MNALFTQTPLAFFIQDLWRDEAFSYMLAKYNPIEILRLTAQDFAPPLYYLVLSLWIRLFGSSEIALRSLSLIFFAGTIFFMFEILIKVFKIPYKRAVVYLLLFMLNPFLVSYAFEARMYMMGAFFVTLSFFALFTKRRFLYIFAITCALYTHYFTILILLAQILTPLFQFIISKSLFEIFTSVSFRVRQLADRGISLLNMEKRSLHFGRDDRKLSFQTAYKLKIVPFVLFLPWLIYFFINHNFSDRSFWVIKPLLTDFKYMPLVLYTGYERIFGEYSHDGAGYTIFHSNLNTVLIFLLIAPVSIFFFINRKLKIDNLKLKIIFWSFFPPLFLFITSFITQPFYFPRYFIFSVPGFLILIILALEFVYKKIPVSWLKINYLLWLILVFVIFQFTQDYNQLNLKYHNKHKVSPMFREINELSKTDDEIYLQNELDYHLAQYYMPKKTVRIYAKSYSEIPQYIGKALISESAFLVDFPIYPARAFMVGYDSYEIVSRQ